MINIEMNESLESKCLSNGAKPFLKWAGGKQRLLRDLMKFVPKEYNNYYEPFLGSGALFFALQPQKAYLSDLNKELINTYKQIKEHVEDVIKYLKKMSYNKDFYYKIREKQPSNDPFGAGRFIYLNKTCWNGLYRVNSQGKFNVPIGRYNNPTICNEENLKTVSRILKKTTIKNSDFEESMKDASEDDLIYFDPPYTTTHKNNNFIAYNSRLFSREDQVRLKNIVVDLDRKGCKVIVSNADHKFIKELYREFKINVVERKSLIAGKKDSRQIITELIITNF